MIIRKYYDISELLQLVTSLKHAGIHFSTYNGNTTFYIDYTLADYIDSITMDDVQMFSATVENIDAAYKAVSAKITSGEWVRYVKEGNDA